MQGHIRANCKIFEVDSAEDAAAWTAVEDVTWPKGSPLDATETSESAVRKHVVEVFVNELTSKLYDHKEFEKSISEEAVRLGARGGGCDGKFAKARA